MVAYHSVHLQAVGTQGTQTCDVVQARPASQSPLSRSHPAWLCGGRVEAIWRARGGRVEGAWRARGGRVEGAWGGGGEGA